MAEEFNPFGLVDESTLRQIRGDQGLEEFTVGQQGLSGIGRGGHAVGFALGRGLKLLGNRTGIIKDKEQERAKAVTRAQRRADVAVKGTPDELRDKDVFGSAIQRREQLIQELEADGLDREAATVRQQIVSLSEQQEKYLKSQGERVKLGIETEQAKLNLEQDKKGLQEQDELVRLQNAYELLDPADPVQAARMDQINSRIEKITTITGTTEHDPSASDKITVRKLEQSIFDNQQTLDGFMLSREQFNPEFLTLAGTVKFKGLKMADIAGLPVPDDMKEQLREFSTFKQQTSSSLNAYIKAITGAQMSNPEAVRLRQDVPTMDDSPEEYTAKLDAIITKLNAVNARAMDAMQYTDDRQQFIQVMASPLEKYRDKGAGNARQGAAVNSAAEIEAEALAILERFEAQQGAQ